MNAPRPDVSGFILKIYAIVGMACNHVVYLFAPILPDAVAIALFSIGGVTFPIMAFLLTEGYRRTSNLKRYGQRLLAFALVSQIPYSLIWGATGNVMFTLLLGLLLMRLADARLSVALKVLAGAALLLASDFCDWGIAGPITIVLLHLLRERGKRGVVLAMLPAIASMGLPALDVLAGIISGGIAVDPGASAASVGILGAPALPTSTAESEAESLLEAIANAVGFLPGDNVYLASPFVVAASASGYAFGGFTLAIVLILGYRGRRGVPLKWAFYAFYPVHLLVLWGVYMFVGAGA